MTLFEARSAAEAAGIQLDMHAPLHYHKLYEGGDDRDAAPAEQIWDLQDFSDKFSGGLSALQQIKLLCEKEGIDVSTTVLGAQKLIAYA